MMKYMVCSQFSYRTDTRPGNA